ncbi:MAG TPA: TIGR03089 family protein [Actinomycetota bacterium]|nr:TIGR03089 family protein [Actinomycetota bacterium]
MTTLREARAAALRSHATVPLITDCTQARVELSHATFDNWVTKTVNFLQLEADITPGATVCVRLPLHWMSAVWLVSAWESGAEVVLGDSPADLVVAVDDRADVLVIADPLGMAPAPADSRAEWVFPADVRGMPDQPVLPRGHMGGLDGLAADAVFRQAQDFALRVGLAAGGRLATDLAPDSVEGVLAAIAGPLAVDASVVYGDASQESPTATHRRHSEPGSADR